MAKEQKKSSVRKWVYGLLGLGILGGGLALAAPYLVPWDKVTAQLSEQGSKALGRKLSLGAVEVSLFTGVHVKDVKLANAGAGFSEQPLFSTADAKVNVSLLSILTGKLVINSISFDKPQVLIETDADGRSNLAGLGGAAKEEPKAEAKDSGKPLDLVIASLQIKDGDLVVRDKQKKSEMGIKGLQLKLYGLSLAAAGGSRLELAMDYESEGKKIPLKVTSNFKLDLAKHDLDIRSLEASVPAVALSGKANIEGFDKAPKVDAGIQVDVDLSKLPNLLTPSQLKKIPGELKSAGKIQLNVAAKGSTADLQAMDGSVKLSFDKVDLSYGTYPGLKDLQGTLSVDKAGAELPALSFKLGGDPATLALKAKWGSLDNLLGGASKLKADIALSLKAPKLNLDPVVAIALADDTPEEAAAKLEQMKDLSVPDLRNSVSAGLSFKSEILVDALEAKGIKTGKLAQYIVLKDRKLQSATNLALYGGEFWERLKVDFDKPGPVWGGQSGLSKLDFAPFIHDLAGVMPENKKLAALDGKLTGALGFKAELSGKGFKRSLRFRNLGAKGQFYMKDGVMKKLAIQEKLAAVIPHPQTQEVLRSDIAFQNMSGDFALAGSSFTLSRFAMGSGDDWRGGDVLVQANGVSEPGRFDFKVTPRFNPKRVQLDGTVGDAFKDDAGWPSYNYIAYYGPSSAEAKADFKAGVANAAKSAVTKAVNRKVEEVKQQAQEKVKEKAGELLKDKAGDALKGLFGQ